MQGRAIRVLLFEDHYESMRYLKEYVEQELGWEVALSAECAILECLRHERFDLVVVDAMVQPVTLDAQSQEVRNVHYDDVWWQATGFEFLRRLREGAYTGTEGTPAGVPAIMLSSLPAQTQQAELSPSLRSTLCLEKPFRLEELVAHMRAAVQE